MNPKWLTKFELKPGTWVFVPTPEGVKHGKLIKRTIAKVWTPPYYYYHLKSGGHVAALRSHLNHSIFLKFDIKNFFGSINKTRVTRCLKKLFNYAQAREIANASTVYYPTGDIKYTILPFGFVQSPILASVCLQQSSLGIFIDKLSKNNEVVVSIYVDDIIISTDNDTLSKSILIQIKNEAERARFFLNDEKEEGPTNQVSAFNIEISNTLLQIKPARMEKFAEVFKNSENPSQRDGILSYIHSINSDQVILLN